MTATITATKSLSRFRKIFSAIREAPKFPTVVLLVFLFCGVLGNHAIFGNLILPHDPNKTSFMDALSPPFWMEGGSAKYILGTDQLGRDLLSRIIAGAGVSLEIGIMVVFFAGLIGSLVAMTAGYIGGRIDMILMRLLDMVISMPFLVLAVTLAAIVGASKYNLIFIISALAWAWYARVLRSEVLRLKEGDFIRLAIVAGCSKPRIMIRHIFPNIVNSLVVLMSLNLGVVIIAEASLSFLGLGVPPPDPAWGSMISEGRNYIGQAWWLCVWPGLAILFTVLSFNLLGDWLRVRLDPKFRQI
ncbi:MAG: ABC transporter permease [Deltaproteobacteria bacterium]|nr:ABC transporter permease [Deltaproteobacteria bacterium]MBW2142350.1 ABC transporter permease [Deltaproteobacteria bacterium]